ncbi:selenide, water dikinase SelD [Thermodesulfovibrio hydrogeniphilus]
MKHIPLPSDPNLLVGSEDWSDAGIYRLTDEITIVQSVDFFTPIVDNPYDFGQIAVANSLSDIYAAGAKPILALNIVCFPINSLDKSILKEILLGGAEKLKEAGVLMIGGHSVEDPEIKYGISVTGLVHPEKFLTNRNAKVGDLLVLTKPIGTGILSTALKGKLLDAETTKILTETMATLNKTASEVMMQVGVNACTDITGFGLIGHALEMAKASKVKIKIFKNNVPLLPKVFDFASMGIVPAGGRRNVNYCSKSLEIGNTDPITMDILSDPQTSGGLLISVPNAKANQLVKMLQEKGISSASVVGEVIEEGEGKVILS